MKTNHEWQLVTRENPSFEQMEVVGFNQKWIDEDFNPNGTRVCFRDDEGNWIVARWNNDQDCYHTLYTSPESIYYRQEEDNVAPTHFMVIHPPL